MQNYALHDVLLPIFFLNNKNTKCDNQRGQQFSIQTNLLQNKRKCNVGNKFKRQNDLLNIIDVNVMHLTNLSYKCKHGLKGCFEA